ncbi:putative f-box domain-containing protein [Phaeoacremonium minimum UCRPA7]|uniref:Putative f-box domain-containing protein n=1 Tax=Phaeoacremonium minimum (strain UCR-PA7) TaxID=1286976 RepID=R8BER8_PHAM7|nr:putative f-box domain-containing protein [Phaeoacremonium minimum UCRPA7]EON97796.1 putative f-box domain-containing protein [Phaeoacremonium minimum UCRPA7]
MPLLITHTNDLTSLALTNSTLHNLAVPHIYARFDIVWPDAHMTSSDTKSVDALTYGLSTLCLGSSFARTTQRLFGNGVRPGRQLSKFVGNEYAKYTRKFSLGNGPNDWVAEYMITKESGKMLGTLVALAVAKMVNLETFVWDMPTGVLSDIFMALSSLPEQHSNQECKLERVWIRWHDNNESPASSSSSSPSSTSQPTAVVPLGSTLTPIGISLPPSAAHPAPRPAIPYSESQVEYPTFSVLPALKSLTVLDIDELAYLDEMAVLVERSKDKLQELRVGVSSKATHKDFVQTWDGDKLQQIDHNARWPGESTIGERRLGGVLGVLVGRVYDIRRKGGGKAREPSVTQPATSDEIPIAGSSSQAAGVGHDGIGSSPANQGEVVVSSELQASEPAATLGTPLSPQQTFAMDLPTASPEKSSSSLRSRLTRATKAEGVGRKRLEGKLKLQTLELERIPLSMQVCAKAFDWTVLTNLTILECAQHENLWKLLKKQFLPTPMVAGFGISPSSSKQVQNAPLQYHLNLKHIHTDITSPALISFIKETLAPNTLEALFLQDRRRASGPPPVTIDAIFRGALKRHRLSLRKLLLDSAAKALATGSGPENIRWRNWVLSTEMILYITSGRMSNLRELAVSMDYRDWHTFLQRLPNVPQLRSLNIPYIADHVIGNFEPKELALQIADIITLRPEIQLCYVGISTKCFEILETPLSDKTGNGLLNGGLSDSPIDSVTGAHSGLVTVVDASDDGESVDTSDDENDDDDDDNDETEDEDEGTPTSPTDPDETQSEHSDGADSEDSFVEPDSGSKTRLRLREILFYDDKVAIFKARHGRL